MKCAIMPLVLLVSLLLIGPLRAQQAQIDSLERLLAHTPADTNRVLLLSDLSNQYKNWGSDQEKTRSYAEQCMRLAYQLDYTLGKGKAHNALGNYYYNGNKSQQAVKQYQIALQYFRQAGRKRELALVSGNLAVVTEDMGNYTKAMEYYLNCNRFAEQIGDTALVGTNLSHMGIFMLNQKKHEEALRYLFKALPIHEKVQNGRLKAFTLNTVGLVYLERKQYDKAQPYLYECLRLCDSLRLDFVQVNCYNNVGMLHFFLQQYEQALGYFGKVLVLGKQLGTTQSMAIALRGTADVYRKTDQTARAITYYKKSLQLAEAHQLAQDKMFAHEGLVQAYAQTQDYNQAYLHQSKLMALKDSIFSRENDRKIAQLQASYAVEKKQAEIALLQQDRRQQIWARNTIVAGLLVSLLITGLVVNRQRLKIRQNRLLVEKSREIAGKNELLERQAAVLASQAEQLTFTNTQLARQSALLEEQTHRLQELDQVKSRFFTNISHEFRTPLTLILAPLEKLLAGRVEAGQMQNHYRLIDRHARRLLQLINQLLDFSKLEAGSLQTDCIRGDVYQRVRIATFAFASLAESTGVALRFVSGYRSIEGLFDPDMLDKILNNLLSNAFKFTPCGGTVTVSVSVREPEGPAVGTAGPEKQPWLAIAVSDTGPGIPADQQERIFDRFYQAPGLPHPEQAGTGIGLALVRELVALQGGSIAVASEAGRGARFTVQLPLAECHYEMSETAEAPPVRAEANAHEDAPAAYRSAPDVPAEAKEKYPLMLVVEDNDEVRGFIRENFLNQFRLVEAADGDAGLKMAQREIPDIIITDCMMPKMDGVTLCRHIRTDERTSHVPVIMLTAKADSESKMEGLETGADDYIPKPFSLHELSVRVKNLIAQRQRMRERFSREVKLQPKDIAITPADEVFLNKAILLIEAHMADTDFSVETLVHEIGMSRVQLHRKLKALTDQSTSEFIRTIRLKRAASLLEGQYGNISEIMYEVGFNNVSYFASSFRKMFGVNPSEYQQEYAKEKKAALS